MRLFFALLAVVASTLAPAAVSPAPTFLLDALPRQPLDGELWLGRGSFDQLSAIVRRQTPDDAEWRGVRYMIFELPDAPGSFSDRYRELTQNGMPRFPGYLRVRDRL